MIIGQLNIRSINNKKFELLEILSHKNIDIICLQETWIKDCNYEFSKNHKIYSKNRDDGYGGVAIIMKNEIKAEEINVNSTHNIEKIAIKITKTINNRDEIFHIFNIYINPKSTLAEIETELNSLTNTINLLENVIICGDINESHPCWDNKCSVPSNKSEAINDFLNYSMLVPLNTGEPTHISYSGSKSIDISACSPNIWDSFEWTVTDTDCGSDHLLILISNKISTSNNKFKRTNYKKSIQQLNDMTDDEISKINTLTELTLTLETTLQNNTFYVKQNPNKRPKAWWNSDLEDQKNLRKNCLRNYLSVTNHENYLKYKQENAKFRKLVTIAKEKSEQIFFESISPSTNITELWKGVRWLTGKSAKRSNNSLKNYISESTSRINEFLDINFKNPNNRQNIELNESSASNQDFTANLNVEELNNILNLKKKTSPGTDKITYLLINQLKSVWKSKLCDVINDAINKQNFIEDIFVNIIPIGKNKSTDIKNYRPIALIPVLIKILNTYVKIKLEEFCKNNKIIPVNSFAYQKHKNTITAAEEIINIITKNKNNNKSTLILYLDFSKAYSTVQHNKLLNILKDIKIPNSIYKWIKNFVNSITLCMEHSDSFIQRKLQEGILQGSVISPILFNIYTKDIHKLEDDRCKIIQYADDFCITFAIGDNDDMNEIVQSKFLEINQIIEELNLNLNSSKTNVQFFRRSNRMDPNITINFNNSSIPNSTNVKYLGINLDHNLNFIEHTSQVINRVNIRIKPLIYVMNRKNSSHPLTNINLVKSLILPVVMYGCSIWAAGRKENSTKIDRIINKSLRIATGLLKSTQINFLRGLTEIPMVTDKILELSLRRICKIAKEPDGIMRIRDMYKFKNRVKEKLFIRHVIKSQIEEIDTNNLEDHINERHNNLIELIKSRQLNLLKESKFSLFDVEIKEFKRFIKKLPGKEAKQIVRLVSGVVFDSYNRPFTCPTCNTRNSINHSIFSCSIHLNLRKRQQWYGKNSLEIKSNELVSIKNFAELIGIKI